MAPASSELERYLGDVRARVEAGLGARLSFPGEDPLRLREACRYAMGGGGKRLRPALLMAACEAVGGALDETAVAAACAIEAVHGYSLVHDDLPAMDDDELRRGRPTVHKAFGEGCAVLVGDALLTAAFGWLADAALASGRHAAFVRAAAVMAEHAGMHGMVGGQARDLAAQAAALDLPTVELLAREKTASLFRAAVVMGGLVGGGDEEALGALDRFATALGVAFQHADDLSDDSRPPLRARLAARQRELCDAALGETARFGLRAEHLRMLAQAVADAA
ncbi:MAG TPA: polyprenyl synthetase family protein [Polyangia bacterium]|jgi:geranylgeranyl pyrophosphate synthase